MLRDCHDHSELRSTEFAKQRCCWTSAQRLAAQARKRRIEVNTADCVMQASILIPTYNRPQQLAETLASVAEQDWALIGEVLIGDDSTESAKSANQRTIAQSPLADRITWIPNDPPLGTYPNHWMLGSRARCEWILFIHDDDHLCLNALQHLIDCCNSEVDERVKIWFGRNYISDPDGKIDLERTRLNDVLYGKGGAAEARPLWQWCLTESVPPDGFLIERDAYVQYMRGPRDGNVGDWGLLVRLANGGAWARYTPEYVSTYRVQPASNTNAGRGTDVHLHHELTRQLLVPPHAQAAKRQRFAGGAPVATVRYLRDGERGNAWRCFVSSEWSWRQRISTRGLATLLMLVTPRMLWTWALRYR